jgi:hypothetical protein
MTSLNQILAILEPRALTGPTNGPPVPALIGNLGEASAWRYVEFFTANIHNPNTRRAYARKGLVGRVRRAGAPSARSAERARAGIQAPSSADDRHELVPAVAAGSAARNHHWLDVNKARYGNAEQHGVSNRYNRCRNDDLEHFRLLNLSTSIVVAHLMFRCDVSHTSAAIGRRAAAMGAAPPDQILCVDGCYLSWPPDDRGLASWHPVWGRRWVTMGVCRYKHRLQLYWSSLTRVHRALGTSSRSPHRQH